MAVASDIVDEKECKQSGIHAEPLSQQVCSWFKEKVSNAASTPLGSAIVEDQVKAAHKLANLPLVQFVETGVQHNLSEFKASQFAKDYAESADKLSNSWLGRTASSLTDKAGSAVDFLAVKPLTQMDAALGQMSDDFSNLHPLNAVVDIHKKAAQDFMHLPAVTMAQQEGKEMYASFINSDFAKAHVDTANKVANSSVGKATGWLVGELEAGVEHLVFEPIRQAQDKHNA